MIRQDASLKEKHEYLNVNASQKQQLECRTLKYEMKITHKKQSNITEKPNEQKQD